MAFPTLIPWNSNDSNSEDIPSQQQTDGVPTGGGVPTTYFNRLFWNITTALAELGLVGAQFFGAEHDAADGTHTDVTADSVTIAARSAVVGGTCAVTAQQTIFTNADTAQHDALSFTFPDGTLVQDLVITGKARFNGGTTTDGGNVTIGLRVDGGGGAQFTHAVDSSTHLYEFRIAIRTAGGAGVGKYIADGVAHNVGIFGGLVTTDDLTGAIPIALTYQFDTGGGSNQIAIEWGSISVSK